MIAPGASAGVGTGFGDREGWWRRRWVRRSSRRTTTEDGMTQKTNKTGLTAIRIPLLILVALLLMLAIGVVIYNRA
jgi:hypothetical protein